MNRRRFNALIAAAVAGLVSPPLRAQQLGRTYRIGALLGGGASATLRYRVALGERLATHGFVEGRNLKIDARGAVGLFHEDRDIAREFVAAKSDAIFTCFSNVTRAAQAATKSVPIVFAWVADPVASGIVKSYAKPGGNITGVTDRFGELLVKRLELIRELLPTAKRIAVVGWVHGPLFEVLAPPLRTAAAQLGFELLEIPGGGDWVGPIDRTVKAGAEALLPFTSFADQSVVGERVVQYSNRHRIPTIFADVETVERGGLISYGTNLVDDVRRGADLLARVLKGAKPADLPVDQAARFELVVNLKAAREIGLTIPPAILLRADRVIE